MIWIRFPQKHIKVDRHHAVLAEGMGGYWTYCGVFRRYGGVKDVTDAPRCRCRCCRGRLARPYLIDADTKRVAAELTERRQ